MNNERLMVLTVSYEDVVKPLEQSKSNSVQSAEVKSILDVIEATLLDKDSSACFFNVEYEQDQHFRSGVCDIYDVAKNDIVLINICYT
jgi:hypothetical protein